MVRWQQAEGIGQRTEVRDLAQPLASALKGRAACGRRIQIPSARMGATKWTALPTASGKHRQNLSGIMLFVIAYDIADHRRLRKVAKCCELYGGRVEKSVFELELDDNVFLRFWGEIEKLLNLKEDSCIAYKICAACEKGIRTMGNVIRIPKSNCIFVG